MKPCFDLAMLQLLMYSITWLRCSFRRPLHNGKIFTLHADNEMISLTFLATLSITKIRSERVFVQKFIIKCWWNWLLVGNRWKECHTFFSNTSIKFDYSVQMCTNLGWDSHNFFFSLKNIKILRRKVTKSLQIWLKFFCESRPWEVVKLK